MSFLQKIRKPVKSTNYAKMLMVTFGIFWVGVLLGCLSWYLTYHQSDMPKILQTIGKILDLKRFMGGLSPWLTAGICVSAFSLSAFRAEINIFFLNFGMVLSYYVYTWEFTGIWPKYYLLSWLILLLFGPVFGLIVWYGKGDGMIAVLISGVIVGLLFNTTFRLDFYSIEVRYRLNLLMLIAGIVHMRRKNAKENVLMVAIGMVFAIFMGLILPNHIL